jgi:hypothetical protein
MKDDQLQTKRPESQTTSCHVRFPLPIYQWLSDKASPQFKSVQQIVIEIVIAAQQSETQREEAA